MSRYPSLNIAIHWLLAIMILIAFAMGFYMVDLTISPNKLKLFAWHKWLGVSILGLVGIRLLSRLILGAPAYPASMKLWEKYIANLTHIILYILMFAVPISGYLYTYAAGFPIVYLGLFELPAIIPPLTEQKNLLKDLHETLTMSMLIVLILHLLAVIKHQFIDKDEILYRMLPIQRKSDQK
ncbi:cytochrome b [Undibacterium fentianense]|uniref:Cytochrome b n=1 Tax=Undibacterium fentianense TaxID=2828728 RepID=A0A941E6G0_9BURK|nr:cytochrome b [Undibacterium fentianense]MBR7799598.1 cytochrome b [Undibacterium fentianense]